MINDVVHEGKVPADWSDSIIVSLFKDKGDVRAEQLLRTEIK